MLITRSHTAWKMSQVIKTTANIYIGKYLDFVRIMR